MKYYHTDVFTNKALSGNGLTVIICEQLLTKERMQEIAKEFKQFETIFLVKTQDGYRARIFTVEEELDFAGHPILGLGAVIHTEEQDEKASIETAITLNKKDVIVHSQKEDGYFKVSMNQGRAKWGNEITKAWQKKYCEMLHIDESMLCDAYPMEVISTGLPYLLIPICKGLEQVEIMGEQLEEALSQNGAKFVYIFDINKLEGRTWDNLGNVEDVATGSAAGPVGAYLYKHGLYKKGEKITLHQGSFLGRPSEIMIACDDQSEMIVAGYVKIVAKGELMLEE